MTSIAPLESARLGLEPITVAHADEMYEELRDPALYRFIPEEPKDGSCIGSVQATVEPDARRAFVAYYLLVRAWGRGYAREALAVVLRHLFERYQLAHVDALIDTKNRCSIRVVEPPGASSPSAGHGRFRSPTFRRFSPPISGARQSGTFTEPSSAW